MFLVVFWVNGCGQACCCICGRCRVYAIVVIVNGAVGRNAMMVIQRRA